MAFLIGSTLERNVLDLKLPPQVLAAATATTVIDDSIAKNGEYASIELFNAGANNAFYAYGRNCSPQDYNAFIVPGQMLVVEVRERVSMYSVGGTTISKTILRRMDSLQANILNPA